MRTRAAGQPWRAARGKRAHQRVGGDGRASRRTDCQRTGRTTAPTAQGLVLIRTSKCRKAAWEDPRRLLERCNERRCHLRDHHLQASASREIRAQCGMRQHALVLDRDKQIRSPLQSGLSVHGSCHMSFGFEGEGWVLLGLPGAGGVSKGPKCSEAAGISAAASRIPARGMLSGAAYPESPPTAWGRRFNAARHSVRCVSRIVELVFM